MNDFLNELFWRNVTKTDGGCWHYNKQRHRGYVRLYVFGFHTIAHRLAWLSLSRVREGTSQGIESPTAEEERVLARPRALV